MARPGRRLNTSWRNRDITSAGNILFGTMAPEMASADDLIAFAKKNPGKLNFGNAGAGSTSHLIGALFASKAGIDVLSVPYKGAAPAMNDLIAGQVDAMFDAGLAPIRIAFVELRDDIQGSELGESMCLERGMVIRIFSQEVEARRWLIYGD